MGLNIQDIEAITLGLGTLEMGGVNLGQLKDNVELQPKIDWLDFKAGVPRQLVKRFILEEGATIKASLAELSATNFRVLSPNATEEILAPGTTVATVKNGVTLVGSVIWQLLGGKNLSAQNPPVVKNLAGTTTYMEDLDYIIDYPDGGIRRTVASSITDGEVVNITNIQFDTGSAKRYHVGGGTQILNQPMLFTHLKPNGKYVKVFFYKSILETGLPLKFMEDKVSLQDITITAIADPTQPAGKQLYYVEFEQ